MGHRLGPELCGSAPWTKVGEVGRRKARHSESPATGRTIIGLHWPAGDCRLGQRRIEAP